MELFFCLRTAVLLPPMGGCATSVRWLSDRRTTAEELFHIVTQTNRMKYRYRSGSGSQFFGVCRVDFRVRQAGNLIADGSDEDAHQRTEQIEEAVG